ncbi:MAG TPA: hypothetical protein VNK23_12095 [Candidatus Dormibacteraeota bacterium]|nr:hypothetical protein [Candidatus Dormibacteraeota bacterium]
MQRSKPRYCFSDFTSYPRVQVDLPALDLPQPLFCSSKSYGNDRERQVCVDSFLPKLLVIHIIGVLNLEQGKEKAASGALPMAAEFPKNQI